MTNDETGLEEAWKRIALGVASDQEKIETASRTGTIRATRFQKMVEALLDDPEDEVRYYALMCLVLDFNQIDAEMQARCWRFLREEPDDDLRAMAATCLGHALQRTRSVTAFEALEAELRRDSYTPYVKAAIFSALFDVVGRPAVERPGLFDSEGSKFFGSAADWAKVEELRAELLPESTAFEPP